MSINMDNRSFSLIIFILAKTVFCVCGPPNVHEGIKTFGHECRYRCNCVNNETCDITTGNCSNGCLRGWMGPACQYRNLASAAELLETVQNPATNLKLDTSSYAVDGDTATCSRTGEGEGRRWLRIALAYMFYSVGFVIKIPNTDKGNFHNFTIDVSNNTQFDKYTVCYIHDNSEIEATFEINCMEPMIGKYVKISLGEGQTRPLCICEVEIYGGRLVSFNKPTSMESTYTNTDGPKSSEYAVDGMVQGPYKDNNYVIVDTCSTTNPTYDNPSDKWWTLDMSSIFSIQSVSFYGRQEKDKYNHFIVSQYTGFHVTSSIDNQSFTEIFKDNTPGSNNPFLYLPKSINLTWPTNGRFLKVHRYGHILNICEVEVYAECPIGKCGWDCNETCMCNSQTTGIHKIFGTCPRGCSNRWTGLHGKCDNKCEDDQWGPSCNMTCGHCINPCSVVNGLCLGPCKPGFRPPECKEGCRSGQYGTNCLLKCGKCKHFKDCDKISGNCINGCQPGYRTQFCNQSCDMGTYGQNCSEVCGNCRNESICNNVNGSCPHECEAGYYGHACHTECKEKTFGMDCNDRCGHCRDDSECDHVSGNCPLGCAPGWKSEFCNTSCDGRYGNNCSLDCGFCKNNVTCHHVDGSCPSGCAEGYTGRLCKTLCGLDTRHNEKVCQENCSRCETDCKSEIADCLDKCLERLSLNPCADQKEFTGDTGSAVAGPVTGVIVSVTLAVVLIVVLLKRSSLRRCLKGSVEDRPSFSYFAHTDDEEVTPDTEEQSVYVNKAEEMTVNETLLDVTKLRSLARSAAKNPTFIYDQFQGLPNGLTGATSEAKKKELVSKNRYKDMLPYNENRVHLPEIDQNSDSTYINASYISGYNRPKKYIAAQGAIKTTIDDIWRLVWSENISAIVMLTNCFEEGKTKCVQYWPDDGALVYGDFRVELKTTEHFANFNIKQMEITMQSTRVKRTVVHYQYTAWPDKDVPDTALSVVQFWRNVRCYVPQDKIARNSPWLVHCSAGVGRTGTFIAADYLYDQGLEEGRVDIRGGICNLRKQRVKMVQTKEQYLLLHEMLAEILDPVGSVNSNDEFLSEYPRITCDTAKNKQKLYTEFLDICKSTSEVAEAQEEGGVYFNIATEHVKDAEKLENIRKSRDPSIHPDDADRPHLSSTVEGCNDFINAVYIPTYRYKDRMMLTQYPLKDTVVDFLRLLWEYNITEIILLEDLVLKDGKYWPLPGSGSSKAVGPFSIELLKKTSYETYILRKLRLKMTGNKQHKDVHQLHFKQWQQRKDVPCNTGSLLQLISALESVRDETSSGPIVIQCLDGSKRCGVFCLVYSVLERLKLDRQIAVAETLRLARAKRRQLVENFEQYKYCHDVIYDYLQSFNVYDNVSSIVA